MKLPCSLQNPVSLVCATLFASAQLQAADDPEYKPELFSKTKLLYSDTFEGSLRTDFWEIRQETTWAVTNGVLAGKPAPVDFQEKKKASGDAAHAGLRPVIWLKQIPENLVCTFRVRFDGQNYQKGFPLIDVGHHIHSLRFSESGAALGIKKEVPSQPLSGLSFSLNEWHTVALELKKGAMLVSIDGKKQVVRNEHIDMTGQSQIDFKGLEGGACQIDDIKIWEGLD
jgi:hypothetical protein